VSDEETAATAEAFVMPSITGLSLAAAAVRLATAGLHIASVQSPDAPPDSDSASPPDASEYVAPQAVSVAATITAQSPAPGHRVTRADNIRVVLSN
jgi:beta-lactam-binding protein with PASTA domain